MLVSMRFLRGLDVHKLERVAQSWRSRYHYPAWSRRAGPHGLPSRALLASDDFHQHPLGRAHWAHRPIPDVVFFHSCAWDLPHINRSVHYYPDRVETDARAELNASVRCPQPTVVPVHVSGGVSQSDILEGKHEPRATRGLRASASTLQSTLGATERLARVIGTPCTLRGDGMSDETIYEGFRVQLRQALLTLRRHFKGRLIVRNCHAGIRMARGDGRQAQALRTMNAIVEQVCVSERRDSDNAIPTSVRAPCCAGGERALHRAP